MTATQTHAAETEVDLTGKIRSLYLQARDDKKSRVEVWNRSYKMVHNRAWSGLRSSWMPTPAASEMYPIVAALVGWMTDQRPESQIVPIVDPHSRYGQFLHQLAKDLEQVMRSVAITHDEQAEVEKVLFDAAIYGVGFFKTIWDESLDGGMGNAIKKRVDPYTIYVDPHATSLDDAQYIIEARNISLDELDRRFPGASKRVMDTATETLQERDDLYNGTGRKPKANPAGINGVPPRFGPVGSGRESADLFDGSVTLLEAWLREPDFWTDDDGEKHASDQWRVVVSVGNHVLMNEKAEDLWRHGKPPYTRVPLNDMGDFWPTSLVEHLTPLQTSLNRLLAAAQSNAELVGNPVFMEDSRSGINRTKITNKPGTRVTKNTGAEAGWMTPPEMPRTTLELINFYIAEMERISGLSAVVRGFSPTQRNSQGVMDSVQEAAFVRVRLALRNLERAMRDAGELQAALIAENYTEHRFQAILGPDGTRTILPLQARHFYVPNEQGAAPLRFALMVQAGSAQPISRQARAQEADLLFSVGGIDRQALLEAHDYPGRAEIIARIANQEAIGTFNPPGKRTRSST